VLLRKLLLQALVVFASDNYVQTAVASWILVAATVLQVLCLVQYTLLYLVLPCAAW
jgi:hypothetical protein